MKKNWFWGVVSVIFISWIGNTIYFESKQLKEPVILNTYIDVPSSEHTSFTLLYITNKNEVVELDSLLVDGYTYSNERNYFPWFGDPSAQSYKQEFTHHFLKEALFTLSEDDIKRLHESIQTDKVLARFTNGQVIPLKVDKLNFTLYTDDQSIFSNTSSFSSNAGIQGSLLEVVESANMEPIELPEVIREDMDLKVMLIKSKSANFVDVEKMLKTDWEDIDAPLDIEINWPLQIEEGDKVGLIFKLKDNVEDVKYIEAMHKWIGKKMNGQQSSYGIYVQVDPTLTQNQVNAIVKKARGAEK